MGTNLLSFRPWRRSFPARLSRSSSMAVVALVWGTHLLHSSSHQVLQAGEGSLIPGRLGGLRTSREVLGSGSTHHGSPSSGIFINSTPSNLQRPWRVRGILGVWPLLLLLLIPLIKSDMSSEGEETSADNQEVISSLLTRSALEFQFTQLVFLLEDYFLCFLPACLSCELRLSTNCSKCVLLLGPNPIHNICKV